MSNPFILQTDVSDSGVCAVLLHVASAVPLYNREGMLRFGAGRPKVSKAFIWKIFLLEIDYQPLVYLSQFKVSNARLIRCAMLLQPYRFLIVAVKSFENVSADCLSRLYISISEFCVYICLLTFFIDCVVFFFKNI